MRDIMNGVYTKYGEDYNFDFYTSLSYSDKLSFVNSVSDILVDGEYYNSVIRDLIFDFYIIDTFTNVDTSELAESLSFVEDVEDFLENTNIVDIVMANVDIGIISELNDAIDKTIAYRTGIHVNPLNEALASLINTIKYKIEDIDLNGMFDIAKEFSNMADGFTTENIMNAYLNSDFHKKNLEEISNKVLEICNLRPKKKNK